MSEQYHRIGEKIPWLMSSLVRYFPRQGTPQYEPKSAAYDMAVDLFGG